MFSAIPVCNGGAGMVISSHTCGVESYYIAASTDGAKSNDLLLT